MIVLKCKDVFFTFLRSIQKMMIVIYTVFTIQFIHKSSYNNIWRQNEMKKDFKKSIIMITVLSLIGGSLIGCGAKKQVDTPKNAAAPSNGNAKVSYPIKTDATLSYWSPLASNLAQQFQTFGDSPVAKELEKKTGVKIKWIHPAVGQEKDQFNILLASGEYPDMIEYDWISKYPGGPDKALADKVIIKLNDQIQKNAPNLKKLLESQKDLDKMVKTDSNAYYVFPMVRQNDEQMVYAGPMVRKDWLDDLKLSVPETIDEWYTVLKAFKEQKGATAPMIIRNYSTGPNFYEAFFGAYNLSFDQINGWFIDDNGKVQYSALQPQLKDAFTTLNKWVKEGLLDKDFPLADQKSLDEKMLNGKAGAAVYLGGGGLNKWQQSVPSKDPKFNLVAAPYPVLKKGDVAFSGQRDANYNSEYSTVITTACKNPDIAAQWLDYGYSTEGAAIYNMGVEGDSYTMIDGVAHYTDKVMKNTEGKDFTTMQVRYQKANGPYIQSTDLLKDFNRPSNFVSYKVWSKTGAIKHKLPKFLSFTDEENSQIIKIKNDLTNYNNEMLVKFIMGQEPLTNFDKYVEQCKKLGAEKAITIYTAALERYNKR